ncbi:DUF302 domain-containing protein [Thermococcus piezophilus]|uniref:DUF302 domain-containing protein n=1 Tax=Thermococcus piezophilus TaxID=1712654 RepID=A0A172WJ85_9EURY|nr:DUF302 domain-containing protein [Thermococcus piezophilus]ANF23532.1 hypothetical protein A7C91_10480 [Thermococcus piezophilus]
MFRHRRKVGLSVEEAEKKFREELAKRGYKVILEFTPSDVIKNNLGVEMEPYRILYVCNPKVFYEMTKKEYEIGSFAPCPVLFYEKDGETYVAINTADDVLDIIKEPLEVVKSVIEDL